MSTITIRKIVIVFFTIAILMVMNAVLLESEFVPSFFGNSSSQGRVSVTGTDSTFSPTVTPHTPPVEWSVSKPLQNEENGETILYNSEPENQASGSSPVSSPQKSPECCPILTQKFSRKNKNISQKDLQDDDLGDSRKKIPSDIVRNAPWPFSATGGNVEVNETRPSVSPISGQTSPSSETVAVVERQGTSAKKKVLPSEKGLKSPDLPVSPAPPPPEAQATAFLAPEPVLPPGYHVAPRVTMKPSLPSSPFPASHEAPGIPLSPAPPQDITLPELPPIEARIRDFPPVEAKTLRDFPPVEESEDTSLLPMPTLGEKKGENMPEKTFQEPIINENAQGNFPMAYGEMELVEPNGYFGVQKPVIIPSVPIEKENSNDLLTIDSVVDLPESEKIREFPKTKD